MSRVPNIDSLEGFLLESVRLILATSREVRFRIEDPIVYPSHPPFDLVFAEPEFFSGPFMFDSVFLRVAADSTARVLSADRPTCRAYEFISEETVPTEGKPFQVEILANSGSRVLYGRTQYTVVGRVIAKSLAAFATDASDLEAD